MRSTQQLLATRYEQGTGNNQQRLKTLERKREKSITAPEKYLDMHTGEMMDMPCNIKLVESADDYYIEYHSIHRLPFHPLSRQENWRSEEKHQPDMPLAERIRTMLTIEEIKDYLLELETKRQAAILECLQGKPDQEVNALLAFEVSDIIKAYQFTQKIPDKFYSMTPARKLMTVPVMLDNTHLIDFHEFLALQPHHVLTDSEREAIAKRYQDYIDRRRYDIEAEKKQFMHLMINNISSATLSRTNILEAQINFEKTYQEKLVQLENFTLERYIEVFEEREQPEYINPITGLPLQSIYIDYKLLSEINDFLDPAKQQILTLQQNLKKYKYHDNEKSYLAILQEKNYPANKIPESLMVGLIPGSDEMEIMTHPVILDGQYSIDYARLKKYWESGRGFFWSENRHGLNPFTGKPLTSIIYDTQLRAATARFIAKLDEYSRTITPTQIRDCEFLRGNIFNFAYGLKPTLWGYTSLAQACILGNMPEMTVNQNH